MNIVELIEELEKIRQQDPTATVVADSGDFEQQVSDVVYNKMASQAIIILDDINEY